jgi:hypothetical protein
MTTTDALAMLPVSEIYEKWKRARALVESMYAWANNIDAQADMCANLEDTFDMDDALMSRIHKQRGWYLVPDADLYPTLEAYIDASYDAMRADVRAYQDEVAAAEAAHRKRRRAELKAERAVEPVPERAQPARASKGARASA